MLTLLLVPLALATDVNDVATSRTIPADAEALYLYARDIQHHPDLWPLGCTKRWTFRNDIVGEGSSANVTYTYGPMHRRRTFYVHETDSGNGSLAATADGSPPTPRDGYDRRLIVDNVGSWGWLTGWTFKPVDGGTTVEITSWVGQAPKPFQKKFVDEVKPAWKACQDGVLANLEGAVKVPPKAAPAPEPAPEPDPEPDEPTAE